MSEYDIEPLVLKDIDGKFFAHGMLTDIENTVAGLVKTTRAQSEEIKELKTALAEEIKAKEEVLAKMKAYADNGVEVTF